jgi:hypothetical protein
MTGSGSSSSSTSSTTSSPSSRYFLKPSVTVYTMRGFKNGLEDLLIPFHGHEMATGLATSVDRCSFIKPRKW